MLADAARDILDVEAVRVERSLVGDAEHELLHTLLDRVSTVTTTAATWLDLL